MDLIDVGYALLMIISLAIIRLGLPALIMWLVNQGCDCFLNLKNRRSLA